MAYHHWETKMTAAPVPGALAVTAVSEHQQFSTRADSNASTSDTKSSLSTRGTSNCTGTKGTCSGAELASRAPAGQGGRLVSVWGQRSRTMSQNAT